MFLTVRSIAALESTRVAIFPASSCAGSLQGCAPPSASGWVAANTCAARAGATLLPPEAATNIRTRQRRILRDDRILQRDLLNREKSEHTPSQRRSCTD